MVRKIVLRDIHTHCQAEVQPTGRIPCVNLLQLFVQDRRTKARECPRFLRQRGELLVGPISGGSELPSH